MSQAEANGRPHFDLSAYEALFLKEARVCLSTLRRELTRLRADPADPAALHEAHRAAHTLRGMSATMHYATLTALATRLEEALQPADEAQQPLALAQVDALLAGCDDFEAGLEQLAVEEGDEGHSQ